jgi:CDP-glycerol glycerophosphotransferase (TagB/SpsB family)
VAKVFTIAKYTVVVAPLPPGRFKNGTLKSHFLDFWNSVGQRAAAESQSRSRSNAIGPIQFHFPQLLLVRSKNVKYINLRSNIPSIKYPSTFSLF